AFSRRISGLYSETRRSAGFSNSPSTTLKARAALSWVEAPSPTGSPSPGISMAERDHKGGDSESPTMPGNRAPEEKVGAAALTPPPLSNPPLSDAPTLPRGTAFPGAAFPGATAALPYARQSSPPMSSAGIISAFHSLVPGVLFGGRYEILGILGQGGMG